MNGDVTPYRKDACERALERLRTAPIDLDEADLDQLEIVGLARDGREARRQAQLAIVQATADKMSDHTDRLQTKGAALAAPENDEEFLQRCGKKTVTYKALFEAIDLVLEILKPLKIRIETLEQTNKDLQTRILELEATAESSRAGTYAER
jgi:hypothetical protein